MKRETNDRRITFSEIGGSLERSLSAVDGERSNELSAFARMRSAKAVQLEREHRRLLEQYGADDARVAEIAAKREANVFLMSGAEREAVRARAAVPAPDKTAWIVHGHVRLENDKPVYGVVVSAHDANGTRYGNAQALTDRSGHFILSIPEQTAAAANRTGSNSATVYLQVAQTGGALLARDTQAFTPEVARVDYREIVLHNDVCGNGVDTKSRDTGGTPQPGKRADGDTGSAAAPAPNTSPAPITPAKRKRRR